MEACHPGLIIIPGLTIFTVTTICIYIYMVATIMRRWGLWQDLSSSDCDSFSRSELLVPLLQPCLQVILGHLWELPGAQRRSQKEEEAQTAMLSLCLWARELVQQVRPNKGFYRNKTRWHSTGSLHTLSASCLLPGLVGNNLHHASIHDHGINEASRAQKWCQELEQASGWRKFWEESGEAAKSSTISEEI